MGFLRIITPGMLITVQDLGREGWGFAAAGVPGGGAADALSLRIGNRLVGNQDGAAGLEMTLVGGEFEFESDAEIALAGGALGASVRDDSGRIRPLELCAGARVGAGSRVQTGPIRQGARSYLCIAGGVRVPEVLGSASAHQAGGFGFGGFEGRALRAGDRLEFSDCAGAGERSLRGGGRAIATGLLERRVLRAVPGVQNASFDEQSAAVFWGSEFKVSAQSDRMGLRLEGPRVPPCFGGRLTSEGMACGAVQVAGNGRPIILGVDQPTTGGYPVIACVATVDLPVLGQLRPGDPIRFERISIAEALDLYRARERLLDAEVPRS